MISQERQEPSPVLVFPSRTRKYVRLAPEQAYESVIHLMHEDLGADKLEGEGKGTSFVKARIGGALGVTVSFRVVPEGTVSVLEFNFSYRVFLVLIPIILITAAGLSLILQTTVPGIGTALILPLAYKVNFTVTRFLERLNEALPYLEREYARMALMEERKRWQQQPRDTEDLYRRLREKHTKTWGNTNVLEYKLAEYEGQGLSRDEAIRKTAEEEGVY